MFLKKSPSFEMQFLGGDFASDKKRKEAVKENKKELLTIGIFVWSLLIGVPLLLKVLFI